MYRVISITYGTSNNKIKENKMLNNSIIPITKFLKINFIMENFI